jgi:hypothetical protein
MNTDRRIVRQTFLLGLFLLATTGSILSAPPKYKPEVQEKICRYISDKPGRQDGKPCRIVVLQDPNTDKYLSVMLMSDAPYPEGYTSYEWVVSYLGNLQKGDTLVAQLYPYEDLLVADNLGPYFQRAGEDEPNCYVFEELTEVEWGNQTYKAIKVTKFGKNETVLIPNTDPEQETPTPSKETMDLLSSVMPGDVVFLQFSPFGEFMKLEGIRSYQPPKEAVFVGIEEHQTVAGTRPVITVKVINREEKRLDEVRAFLPGEFLPSGTFKMDSIYKNIAESLKPNQRILFRTASPAEEGQLPTVNYLKLDPKANPNNP